MLKLLKSENFKSFFYQQMKIHKHKKVICYRDYLKSKCVGSGSKERLLASCRPFQHVQII